MKQKRYLALGLALCLLLSLFAGCGRSGDPALEPGFTITVDRNGLATWEPVEGAVAYWCDYT